MKESGIYCWTNLVTGKKYIGRSIDLQGRKADFLLFHGQYGGRAIDSARKKYDSIEYWKYEVLEYCDVAVLNERERYYIAYYDTYRTNKGYNLTEGGDGLLGFHHREETKIKLSIINRNRDREIIERQRQKLIGRHHTEEHKRKIGDATRGRIMTEEHKRKIGDANRGRKPSQKAIQATIRLKSKPVHQIDKETGEIIQTFNSIADACRSLHCDYNIIRCCKGKQKTAYGFKWAYA